MKFLCVMLLIFSGCLKVTSEHLKVVGPAASLVAKTGEDLVLLCSLQPNISAEDMRVEWIRADLPALVHLYEDNEDRNNYQSKSFRGRTSLFKEELQKGNVSLKLSALQPSDQGAYQCAVSTPFWNNDITLHVEVDVHLKVVGPAAPLVAEAGEDLVLPCSLQPNISAENMMVEWIRLQLSDTLVHLYKDHQVRNEMQMESYRGRTSLFREELRKGNVSLKLSDLQLSDEGVYQCALKDKSWFDDVIVYVEVKEKVFHAWKIAIICLSVFGVIMIAFTTYILTDKYSVKKLSPYQCSIIAYMHLRSNKIRDQFILKNYNTSLIGYRRLIPTITNYRRARLADCRLGTRSMKILRVVLQSENSHLNELDLSYNDLQDSGVNILSDGLKSPQCKLEILRLVMCELGKKSCDFLRSVLESETSSLKELDLSHNDLQDSGVELLSDGLKSSHCKLEILSLSGCMVTEIGCSSLALALKLNPSHLKELDLSFNHPGESGVKELSDLREDLHYKLDILRLDHGGEIRLTPGIKKYFCRLTLDPNTAHHLLVLSEENRVVEFSSEDQNYSDHPERFDVMCQVLSKESVSGRCYWEVEWSSEKFVFISVSYKEIKRKGEDPECIFGCNSHSWRLRCSSSTSPRLTFIHNNVQTSLPDRPSSKIGVHVDHSAGTLSFYNLHKDTMTLLCKEHITFTQPLYAGFSVPEGTIRFCEE